MTRRGVFVCIEGIDASGKTTQANLLVKSLRQRGFDAIYTTEPSTGEIGKLLRRYVLDRKKRVPVTLEALLFAADRVDHVEKEIKPALQMNKIVVCDRYVYSTLAYQGTTHLVLKWIEEINKFALVPDLALFIDVSPELAIERINSKSNRSVMETLKDQRSAFNSYSRMVEANRLVRIDGNKSVNVLGTEIFKTVISFLQSLNLLQS